MCSVRLYSNTSRVVSHILVIDQSFSLRNSDA